MENSTSSQVKFKGGYLVFNNTDKVDHLSKQPGKDNDGSSSFSCNQSVDNEPKFQFGTYKAMIKKRAIKRHNKLLIIKAQNEQKNTAHAHLNKYKNLK